METQNKETFRRFHEASNSGDLEVLSKTIDEAFAPNAVFHAPMPAGVSAAQAVKDVWSGLLRAFPDIQVTVEDLIAEGDKVVSRNTVTGTNTGEYRGQPPTGKTVTYNEVFIVRFEDGLIAEIWGVVDVLTQLRQLGMIHV